MNYTELVSNVQSFLGGRSDVPSYVYELVTADINRDFRLLEMQTETTLTASAESVTLPADFLELESVYIASGGVRWPLRPATESAQAVHWDSSGQPRTYAVHDGELTLMPVPDSSYTLTVRYYAKLAEPSGTDENAVMAAYPGLYLYGAAAHASLWSGDSERLQMANSAYAAAVQQAKLADKRRRMGGGPIVMKSAYSL